jgi:hypothetical protein
MKESNIKLYIDLEKHEKFKNLSTYLSFKKAVKNQTYQAKLKQKLQSVASKSIVDESEISMINESNDVVKNVKTLPKT